MQLFYHSPATAWTEALPLANGHLGAIAYGDIKGRYDLSEATCWSGKEQQRYVPLDAATHMARARQALLDGDIVAGEEHLLKARSRKENYGTQLPMATLFAGLKAGEGDITRRLELRTGLALDALPGGVSRQSFISNPDKVMVIRFEADGRPLPNLAFCLEGLGAGEAPEWDGETYSVNGKAVEALHSDGESGVCYRVALRLLTDGRIAQADGGLCISGAKTALLILTAATTMFDKDIAALCATRLDKASKRTYQHLYDEHTIAHARWMDACTFTLPATPEDKLPTDVRLEAFKNGADDPTLGALLFAYGRYLLLNSSWPDSKLPAALQGLWNDDRACRMGWTDDMHLDINTQLNYYPAHATGLGACMAPLFRWIQHALSVKGTAIAKELYGLPGWVAHTVSNAYGWAAPGWGGCDWSFNTSGGGWIAYFIWQHYLYTKDREFLHSQYSTLRGAAEFLHAAMMPHPKTGELIVTPSFSPENAFLHEGEYRRMCAGATMDQIVAVYLMKATIKAAKVLEIDDALVSRFEEDLPRIATEKIGKHGQLMEWYEEYEEAIPDHRHTSHMLGLYPFDTVHPLHGDQSLVQAMHTTLERRMQKNAKDILEANWSGTLLMIYFARLLEGDKAADCIRHLLTVLCQKNLMITHKNGIYELDGNTGFTCGVSEMLLQSREGEIHLLPALPAIWPKGSFTGMIAVSGHSVSVTWDNGAPARITITPALDEPVTLRFNNIATPFALKAGHTLQLTLRDGAFVAL